MKIRTLTDSHEHAGNPVPTGTEIDAPDGLAKYMIENGLAEPVLSAETNKTKGVASHGPKRKPV